MASGGSSVPKRQLGRYLKQAREEAGIPLEAAAKRLEWSRARMYRIEGAQTSVRTHDVELMCRIYGTSDEMRSALVALAAESKSRGWWHAYGDAIPEWFELYVGLEAAACHLRWYEPALIPGLLQTPDYMTAVFQTKPGRTADEVARKVALRLERQRLLTRRSPAAPRLEVVIDESVVRRPPKNVGGWQEQLAHLANVGQSAANVSVRLLPMGVGPHSASVAGAFVVLDFPRIGTRPAEPSTVYSEALTGSLYLDRPGDVSAYVDAWSTLWESALDERASEDLLSTVIKESYDE
ncbi:helix-turn-helix domain-containing protein [Salinispora tropica]|uniref:Helix-turn-helix domain protein n=1 Tax=Salinispora tropica (strain ATCC BAA-916 / DSM 44818 / JCM 13857 / NBRC 105044 / CNB-440) TaxID=369723 RepID=A4X7P6_SALTO|nr:helix-turn-helix transcriptional regulator [Salinispora tropica]ABP54896.1 helix-turn-helix domain protein [Salinispora tropica CNB-440]